MEKLFFGEKYREKNDENHPYSNEGVIIDRQKFVAGVVGIGHGAGATFIAMGLAARLAEMTSGVTYFESTPHGDETVSPYRLLAVDRTFREKARKNICPGGLNLYRKVNWQISRPGEEVKEPNVRNMTGRIIVADSPSSFNDMDIIIAVADPFPPRITAGLEMYGKLREISQQQSPHYRKVIWMLNKSCGWAARIRTENFLKLKFDVEQEMISPGVLYKAAYNCTMPYFMCETAGIDRLAEMITESV